MKWYKYETLYVNGSSLTAGGGLGNSDIKDEYKRVYGLEWNNEKDITYDTTGQNEIDIDDSLHDKGFINDFSLY